MSDINQDDIDKLLQDALVGGDGNDDSGAADAAPPADAPSPLSELEGAASQDDIDALFAAVDSGEFGGIESGPAADAPPPEEDGPASQDDIDALFSAAGDEQPAPEEAAVPPADAGNEPGAPLAEDESAEESSPDDPADARDDSPLGHRGGTAAFESRIAQAEADADREMAEADSGLNELLSSIAGEGEDGPPPETDPVAAPEPEAAIPPQPYETEVLEPSSLDDIDMEALLREVEQAAPPPPPEHPRPEEANEELNVDDTAELAPNMRDVMAEADSQLFDAGDIEAEAPAETPVEPSPARRSASQGHDVIHAAPADPGAPPPAAPGRREYSVLYGAGEVESIANQIASLLNAMSEKAHGYMQAWIAADSEAKELRSRALAEERKLSSLAAEKTALAGQMEELRSRVTELEGNRIAVEEARRTLETAHQAKVRELESQVSLLSSEAETLKNELTRALNQATGVDIESRRARFEVDRLKNEVESERMERLRIQRALENREKELQATQAQSSGQASSLFIDELHRLVRRLESELDARTSGAHEALKQLDRLEASENQVPVLANMRASLMQAVGRDSDADDALKNLGREAAGVKGPAALEPAKVDMVSFETALSTYNLTGAVDVAGALLRDAGATPGSLMRKIYQCPALRRPEVADHISDLSRLLEGLRTVQESNDRTRGSETGESEVFYVHMFDFLHNLVRLKLITRLSGDAWRLFLDLRGRFSFVTSDRQWAEYRDKTLKS